MQVDHQRHPAVAGKWDLAAPRLPEDRLRPPLAQVRDQRVSFLQVEAPPRRLVLAAGLQVPEEDAAGVLPPREVEPAREPGVVAPYEGEPLPRDVRLGRHLPVIGNRAQLQRLPAAVDLLAAQRDLVLLRLA